MIFNVCSNAFLVYLDTMLKRNLSCSYQSKLEAQVCEGASRDVGHVSGGVDEVRLVLICVQPEMTMGFGRESRQTDLYSVGPDVKLICKVLNKFELMLEVTGTLAGGGIQQKHDVGLVSMACYNREHSSYR